MASLHPRIAEITQRIIDRSKDRRAKYLAHVDAASTVGVKRKALACTNLAHAFAAEPKEAKILLKQEVSPNLAIVSAYNDMLSAHQPLGDYPALLKQAARDIGATAQFAGGVPAMCDGVTQGQPGMELSLFSRDIIAQATAIGLSHNMFDAALYLGVCDKIVPGLLIGALSFGHLPAIFVPAGPMVSGIANDEKARIRKLYAQGKATRDELLESEIGSYHSAGTCTFYGTANSNQMLMEIMGLHLPGSAFVNPGTEMRTALTKAAATRAAAITQLGKEFTPVGKMIDEKAIVNGIIGLLTTGGSTNHTMHLNAIAHAAGIKITWDDFNDLSDVIPLLARVYPNGKADVNHFHAAGGIGFVIRELLDAGLLHEDVLTIAGPGLRRYTQEPTLETGALTWKDAPLKSGDSNVVATAKSPFSADGGLKALTGNLGRAVIKTSAVKEEHRVVEAPAIVFNSQEEVQEAFQRGELNKDFIAVVRYQGPRANGMPELHGLTPAMTVLQDQGFKVALVTDGRMSGASGKVPAAIHITPETLNNGPLGKVRNGDIILMDSNNGILEAKVPAAEWAAREIEKADLSHNAWGMGRELFAVMRANSCGAEDGAMSFVLPENV